MKPKTIELQKNNGIEAGISGYMLSKSSFPELDHKPFIHTETEFFGFQKAPVLF